MFKKKAPENQSLFSAQGPLYEKVAQTPEDPRQAEAAGTEQTPLKPDNRPFYRKKPFIIGAVGVPVLIIIVLLVLVQLKNNAEPTQTAQPSPTSSPAPMVNRDPLQQRIDRVQDELQAADPNRQQLPFPPVNTSEVTIR